MLGIDKITKKSVHSLCNKFSDRNDSFFKKQTESNNIKSMIVDVVNSNELIDIIESKDTSFSRVCQFAFTLPTFHKIDSKDDLLRLQNLLNNEFTCLDGYIDAFEVLLKKAKEIGVVCIKDQSAYRRKINYSFPQKKKADEVFSKIIESKKSEFSNEESSLLDDWLFNYFIALAEKYDLPIQIHTGHLAGNYGDIRKAKAVELIPTLENYPKVFFDLFHGNWPYMDEYLFIGKNFPNVSLDLCWAHAIDPIYCIELNEKSNNSNPAIKNHCFWR